MAAPSSPFPMIGASVTMDEGQCFGFCDQTPTWRWAGCGAAGPAAPEAAEGAPAAAAGGAGRPQQGVRQRPPAESQAQSQPQLRSSRAAEPGRRWRELPSAGQQQFSAAAARQQRQQRQRQRVMSPRCAVSP